MKQIITFVMFAAMLCWLLFSPIYKHVLLTRQAVIQQEVDFLLEVGASGMYGYVSSEMIEKSKQRLASLGFEVSQLSYSISSSMEYIPSAAMPLPRGEILSVEISYPYEDLFLIDSLIGIDPPDANERIRSFGVKMSEYVKRTD